MKKLILLLVVLCLSLGGGIAQAEIFSADQQRVFQSGVRYFNTERDCVNGPVTDPKDTACVCQVSVDTTLNGNDNIEKAYRYFVGAPRSLIPEQSAGIVGNLRQESGVNPSDPGGYIAQWGGGRLKALEDFAKKQNKPVTDLGVQLDYIWLELTNGPGAGEDDRPTLAALKAATSAEAAALVFSKQYERPGDPRNDLRVKYANEVLATYGGGSTGATPIVAGSSQGCSGLTGPGQDSKYVDGFLVYSQYDPAWKDKPYSSSTIGASGCGPSAMAMIITALTGQSVTPVATADYAASQNLYVTGSGSSWAIGPKLAEHWGLKSQQIGKDLGKITAALQSGALVITAGQGPEPFTSSGHYIVIRAVTASGKFKIGDSGHSNTSDKEWDPQQLMSSMADGSVYAITK